MTLTREQREQRSALWSQMQEIRETVDKSGWTAELRKKWDDADGKFTDISRQARGDALDQSLSLIDDDDRHVDAEDGIRTRPGEVDFLDRNQKLTDWIGRSADRGGGDPSLTGLSLAKMVRGWYTDNWDKADREQRAQAEGTPSAGGYTVPTPLAAEILDLARNQSRVLQAGARTVPMTSQTLKFAKVLTDPQPAWHLENGSITPDDGTFGVVTLTARALTGIVKMSLEFVEDSIGGEAAIRNGLGKMVGQAFDFAALYGPGSASPEGLTHANNSVSVTYVGGTAAGTALTNYDQILNSRYRVQANNYEPTAMICNPRLANSLAKLKESSTGAYLAPPPQYNEFATLTTNQVAINETVGGDSTCESFFMGDWRQLLLGLRTSLTIRPLMERYAENGQIALMCWFRGDVAVARSDAFDIVSGIKPAS